MLSSSTPQWIRSINGRALANVWCKLSSPRPEPLDASGSTSTMSPTSPPSTETLAGSARLMPGSSTSKPRTECNWSVEIWHPAKVFDLDRFVRQSPYSRPGRYADRLAALPDDLASLCAASRNVIAHYRAELPDLPEERRGEMGSRWLEVILGLDQQRHPAALDRPRPLSERVAGCCRDHSLLVVGALRQRGRPARNRVGFAHYFTHGWAADHVIIERWHERRWQRADPELGSDSAFDVHDIPTGDDAPFETAAEAWLGWRNGDRDLSTYGLQADRAFTDQTSSGNVIFEVAHRYGDEMLL